MSQAQIGNLQVALGINTAQFAAGLAQARGSLSSFEGSLKSFAAGFAGALSLGAVTAALKSGVDHMDELGKAAQKIGIPVDELSKLEYAAQLADVSLDDLTTTLAKFSKNIAEIAAGGQNDTGQALKALGISAVDAQGKLRPTIEIFGDIADKFANMQDGAGKTALAIALLGKSGAELIPLMNGGREAINGAGDELARFGGVVTPEAAAAAETFNDNITRLGVALQSLTQKAVIPLLQPLTDITEAILDFANKSSTGAQGIGTIETALKYLTETALKAYTAFWAVGELANTGFQNMADPQGFDVAMQRWDTALEHIRMQNEATEEAIRKIWHRPIEVNIPYGDGSNNGKTPAPKVTPTTKPQSSPVPKIPKDTIDSIYGAGEAFHTLWDRMAEGMPDVNVLEAGFQSLATSISESLGNAIQGLILGTMSLKDAFTSMAQSLAQQLAQLAAQIIQSQIFRLISMLAGNMGGFTFGGMSFDGFFADGGNLGSGKWGIAGEAGPEIIKGPASITPMDKVAGGSPQMNVTVINNSSASVNTRKNNQGDLEVMVEDMLAEKLIRGGNKIDAALARGYGLRRAGRS
jgi:hypothetical protein